MSNAIIKLDFFLFENFQKSRLAIILMTRQLLLNDFHVRAGIWSRYLIKETAKYLFLQSTECSTLQDI
jgi:hypothetical protein